ncbi:hypothetical protein B879_04041 [Cecembia lonarensis LW9]|uniref:Uncharacterized protein n=1 Tax=Cecembia lonarensis (strain CCUG 58316 / KCTC 22772 / LW9) TaxID=1225176 RepID=K1LAF0_CECL9|nr:hypothetical protein B879_04041 [Cecembia lonarensis LW9]
MTNRRNRHPDPDGLGEGSHKAKDILLRIGKVTYKTTCPMHWG